MIDKFIVYEYTEKASPAYRGCRFMTVFTNEVNPNANIKEGRMKIVAQDVTEEEAYKIIKEVGTKNADAFLNDMSDELRSPENDAFIRALINGI